MIRWYDRQGRRLPDPVHHHDEWVAAYADLHADPDYIRVAATELGDTEVSTVWLGLDRNFGQGPPLIFETMIFGGHHDQACWRWSSEAQAIAGHDQIVARLRAMPDVERGQG